MSSAAHHDSPTGATRNRVGGFRFDIPAGVWDWDDEVYRIHGLEPQSISPTAEFMLSCKHPDDRDRVVGVLAQATIDGKPFSLSYRLITAEGAERKVLLVCDAGVRDEDGAVTSIEGYYIDLTDDFRQESREVADHAVAESARHRASIERAVGALMVAYALDADQAFEMLRWWSQNKNVKVRELAQRLELAMAEGASSDVGVRRSFDVLLHELTEDAAALEGRPAPPQLAAAPAPVATEPAPVATEPAPAALDGTAAPA